MIKLSTGQLEPPEDLETMNHERPAYATAKLNDMLAGEKLPEAQGALSEKIRTQLQGSGVLSLGHEPGDEGTRFRDILDRLVPEADIVGGPKMAEAVLNRQSRLINKGGMSGLKEATGAILPYLSDPLRKTGYLLSLKETELGQTELAEDISQNFEDMFATPTSINQIVLEKISLNKMMSKLTAVYNRIGDSGLETESKQKIAENLDDLLAKYIVESKILEKLNDPSRPLNIRAFMLISMRQPEMLPRGKAASLARNIIVEHLRQPNFEAELVSEITDATQKEETLRRFHEQLHRSGFFG